MAVGLILEWAFVTNVDRCRTCTNKRNHSQNREDYFFSSVAVGLFLEWAFVTSVDRCLDRHAARHHPPRPAGSTGASASWTLACGGTRDADETTDPRAEFTSTSSCTSRELPGEL